jgi:hypothetical protein
MITSRERNPIREPAVQSAVAASRFAKRAGQSVKGLWWSDSVLRIRYVATYRVRQAPRDLSRLS